MDNEIEINTKEGIYKVNGTDISMSNKIVVIILTRTQTSFCGQ